MVMRLVMAMLLVCTMSPLSSNAATYIVQPDGGGDFSTIQAAVDACIDNDVIELTDGIFLGAGNLDVDYLGKAITIASQSNDPDLCTIDCEASASNPHRAFLFQNGETGGSVLRGITIAGGFVSDDDGGAVLILNEAVPLIDNCVFDGNTARDGGAIALLNPYPDALGSALIRDCLFIDNAATAGGAIACRGWDVRPNIESCRFESNTASSNGGALHADVAGPAMTDCTFENNGATYGGGALSFIDIFDFVSLIDCRFIGNSSSSGGAIEISEGSPAIDGCLFAGNIASGGGGAIMVWDWAFATPILSSTFVMNAGSTGSAISANNNSQIPIGNCIFAFNIGGAAIACANGGVATLSCCDVFGNVGGDWVGCLAGQDTLNDNFSANPLFCDAEEFDLTLHVVSPCLPESSPCGELVGALGLGCGVTGVTARSWSEIKGLY